MLAESFHFGVLRLNVRIYLSEGQSRGTKHKLRTRYARRYVDFFFVFPVFLVNIGPYA